MENTLGNHLVVCNTKWAFVIWFWSPEPDFWYIKLVNSKVSDISNFALTFKYALKIVLIALFRDLHWCLGIYIWIKWSSQGNVSRKQTIFDGDCRKISKLFKSYYDVLDVLSCQSWTAIGEGVFSDGKWLQWVDLSI